jgi:hypothetical protein
VLTHRYVLHLVDGGRERIVRHLSARPLEPGVTVSISGHGEWVVVDVVANSGDPFKDGIAYARRAEQTEPGDRAAAS